MKQAKCIKKCVVEKVDGDGFGLGIDFITKEGSIWNVEEDSFRMIEGEVRLTNDEGWLEIPKETFEERFEIVEDN